jgi:acetyl esterase/lipase
MKFLRYILFLLQMTKISAQNGIEMPLYADKTPNSKDGKNPETVETRANGSRFISRTAVPTLTIFIPEIPSGKAVIVCPGGGYRGTSIDNEGLRVAKALNEAGIAAFVLKYRSPNDSTCVDKSLAPLQDAQQAIRLVRQNAIKWQVNSTKVGIMGFSAGGHLASTTATHFSVKADISITDTTSLRPDFVILGYPVISFSDSLMHKGSRDLLLGKKPTAEQIQLYSNDLQVTPQSPPTFLLHAADDKTVKVENSIAYYMACLKNSVPVEMHLYPKGGHGFGLNNTTTEDKWFERLLNWIKGI